MFAVLGLTTLLLSIRGDGTQVVTSLPNAEDCRQAVCQAESGTTCEQAAVDQRKLRIAADREEQQRQATQDRWLDAHPKRARVCRNKDTGFIAGVVSGYRTGLDGGRCGPDDPGYGLSVSTVYQSHTLSEITVRRVCIESSAHD